MLVAIALTAPQCTLNYPPEVLALTTTFFMVGTKPIIKAYHFTWGPVVGALEEL